MAGKKKLLPLQHFHEVIEETGELVSEVPLFKYKGLGVAALGLILTLHDARAAVGLRGQAVPQARHCDGTRPGAHGLCPDH